jgi:hypothetical protein
MCAPTPKIHRAVIKGKKQVRKQKEILVDMVHFGLKNLHIPILKLQTVIYDSFLSINRIFPTLSFRMSNVSDGVFIIEALLPVKDIVLNKIFGEEIQRQAFERHYHICGKNNLSSIVA